jgi:hypothetical protein
MAVDGLIDKLEGFHDDATRRLAFKALCRLDHREADYTGDWWTTRPDTSGPYYKAVKWEQSGKIERALGDALKRSDSHSAGKLLVELVRNKVELIRGRRTSISTWRTSILRIAPRSLTS